MYTRAFFALLILIFAVSSSYGDNTKITLQLKWYHQYQFAGYYMALHKGFYKDEGLDVEIKEVVKGSTPAKEVLSGRADFGISTSSIITDYIKGKPIVAVSAFFQESPLVFVTRKDSGISSVHDLAGKKVMLLSGSNSFSLIVLLKKYNLYDKVKIIKSSYNINDLINGKTDAFNAYLSNEPFILESKNIPGNIINPYDYGIKFYGDILFTSKRFAEQNRTTIEKFRKATVKGWEYATQHKEETIEHIVSKYTPGESKSKLRYEANILEELMHHDYVEPGYMNKQRWISIVEYLMNIGIIKHQQYNLDSFIYDTPKEIDWHKFLPYAVGFIILIILSVLWRYYTLYKSNLKLQEKERQLMQQSKYASMGEMIDAISHQLKQPINGMSLLMQTMEAEAEQKKYDLDQIEIGNKIVAHMSATIDDFRNFFKNKDNKHYFSVPKVMLSTLEITRGYLFKNLINLNVSGCCEKSCKDMNKLKSIEVPDYCPAVIYGNSSELKQVFLILLQNAKESLTNIDENNRNINISMQHLDDKVIVTIEDSGIGIAPEILPEIFQKSVTNKKDGSGLGLYLCKIIVENNFGGTLKAANSNKGALFTLELPNKIMTTS